MSGPLEMLSGIAMPETTDFPVIPYNGQFHFKDGILYFYGTFGGTTMWFPINHPQATYTHFQALDNTVWTVQHNLGSNELVMTFYDHENKVMTPASTQHNLVDDKWQTTATFAVGRRGFAVFFGKESLTTPFINADTVNATTSMTISDKPVMVDADVAESLDAMAAEFDNFTS